MTGGVTTGSGGARDVESRAGRFWFAMTLMLAMGVGPVTIYALSTLSPLIIADLGISRSEFGLFAGLAFAVAAAVSPLCGRWADAFRLRVLLLVLFAGSGVSLVAVAAAPSAVWMFLAVAVCGAGQAMSNPLTNQLLSITVSGRRRGALMGLKQAGVQMGQLGAGLAFPALALWLGWRGAALSATALAVAGVFLSLHSVPGRLRAPARVGVAPEALPRSVWWLAGWAFLTGVGLQATNVYLPLFGFEVLGLSVGWAGLAVAFSGAMGIAGRIVWARVITRMSDPVLPFVVLASVSTVGVLLIMLAGLSGVQALMWIGIPLFAATASPSTVVVMLAVLRTVPAPRVGAASGLAAVGMYGGFAVGPVGFGVVLDLSGSYPTAWALAAAAFGIAALSTTRVIRRLFAFGHQAPGEATGDSVVRRNTR